MLGHGLKAVDVVISHLPVFWHLLSSVPRRRPRELCIDREQNDSQFTPSVISPPLPLLTRLDCATKLWFFKFLVTMALGLFRVVKRGEVNAVKPTYTKRYDVRPMLEKRVFIPKNWKAGSKLPSMALLTCGRRDKRRCRGRSDARSCIEEWLIG